MKTKTLYISLFTALIHILSGCSNDFLLKEYWKPVLNLEMTAELPHLESGRQQISFTIPGAENSAYSIVQFPSWMIPEKLEGNATGDVITLYYSYNSTWGAFQYISSFNFGFEVASIGQVEVSVVFGEGTGGKEEEGEFENKDLFAIEGTVRDAIFDKAAGIIYIATQSPDRIVIYNTTNDSESHVALAKAPKCIKLSESGDKAFVGHSGLLSVINTRTESVESSIDVDYNIFDLAYGENDWCYISLDDLYKSGLYMINIKTRKSIKPTSYGTDFYDHTYLTKIKGKPLLIGSRKETSPSGVILGDITNPETVVEKYWHESYGRFWFSEDFDFTYSSSNRVFKTPDMNTGELFVLYSIDTQSGYTWSNFNYIEHSKASNSIWVSEDKYSSWDSTYEIRRFDCLNYTLQEIIYPAKSQGYINGEFGAYPTTARFLFVNKNAENLFIIKNITLGDDKVHNGWSVQKIKIN